MTYEAELYKSSSLLDTLITSKTRVKLLLKFFVNTSARSYLRNLASEFDESSNSIRVELNKLEEAGLLESEAEGNRRYFQANRFHPLFSDINSIVRKYIGLDHIIDSVIVKLGTIEQVFLIGPIVKGVDQGVLKMAIVGRDINAEYLKKLSLKAEEIINKKINYMCFEPEGFAEFTQMNTAELFMVWDVTE